MRKNLVIFGVIIGLVLIGLWFSNNDENGTDCGENVCRLSSVSEVSFFSKTWASILKQQRVLSRKINQNFKAFKKTGDFSNIWNMLAVAFTYGLLHAIGPGHGKFLVVSYFTTKKARKRDSLVFGFSIGLVHILSAVILVLTTEKIAKFALGLGPSEEMQFMKMISYIGILIVGMVMLANNIRDKKCCDGEIDNEKSILPLALSIGLVPCTGALLLLFYAMSKDILMLGILSAIAIGTGISITLTLIGLFCILAKDKINIEHKHNNKLKWAKLLCPSLIIIIAGYLIYTTV